MLAALLLVAASPMFQAHKAAAAQVTNRSIEMTDAASSGTSVTTGVGSGTNVTYRVSFTAIAASAQSLIIDFCSQTPLMNASCTRPAGMTTNAAALAAVSGDIGTGWSIDTTPPNPLTQVNGRIMLTSDGAHDIAPGPQVFDLTGITNPSTVGSFYARIYTFSNTTYGTYADPDAGVDPAGAGDFVDFGGIALSTVNVITITARVQEQLTFCITKATGFTDCSDAAVSAAANLPAIVLGHTVNGIQVLDSGAVDTGTINSQLSTNATNGAVVRMRNSNLTCGGLSADNGTTCAIPAINAGAATASAMTAGTAAFGLFVSSSTLGTNGIGALTPTAAYHNGSHVTVPGDVWYGMDTGTANDNVTSTFGSTLCSTPSPVYRVNNSYTFAATAALTTPAGIYTANLSMIATGTF
jgi:hypothetical protein